MTRATISRSETVAAAEYSRSAAASAAAGATGATAAAAGAAAEMPVPAPAVVALSGAAAKPGEPVDREAAESRLWYRELLPLDPRYAPVVTEGHAEITSGRKNFSKKKPPPPWLIKILSSDETNYRIDWVRYSAADMAKHELFYAVLYRLVCTRRNGNPVVPKSCYTEAKKGSRYATRFIESLETLWQAQGRRGYYRAAAEILDDPENRHLLASLLVAAPMTGNADASDSNMALSKWGELTEYDFGLCGRVPDYPEQEWITPATLWLAHPYRWPSDRIERTMILTDTIGELLALKEAGRETELNTLCLPASRDPRKRIVEEYRLFIQSKKHFFPEVESWPSIVDQETLWRVVQGIRSMGFMPARYIGDKVATIEYPDHSLFAQIHRRVAQEEKEKATGRLDYTLQDITYEAWLKWLLFPPTLYRVLCNSILTPRIFRRITLCWMMRRFELYQSMGASPGFSAFLKQHGRQALENIRNQYQAIWTYNSDIRRLFGGNRAEFDRIIKKEVCMEAARADIQTRVEEWQNGERVREQAEQRFFRQLNGDIEQWVMHFLTGILSGPGLSSSQTLFYEIIRDCLQNPGWKASLDDIPSSSEEEELDDFYEMLLKRWYPVFCLIMMVIRDNPRYEEQLRQFLPRVREGMTPAEELARTFILAINEAYNRDPWYRERFDHWRGCPARSVQLSRMQDVLSVSFTEEADNRAYISYFGLPSMLLERYIQRTVEPAIQTLSAELARAATCGASGVGGAGAVGREAAAPAGLPVVVVGSGAMVSAPVPAPAPVPVPVPAPAPAAGLGAPTASPARAAPPPEPPPVVQGGAGMARECTGQQVPVLPQSAANVRGAMA